MSEQKIDLNRLLHREAGRICRAAEHMDTDTERSPDDYIMVIEDAIRRLRDKGAIGPSRVFKKDEQ